MKKSSILREFGIHYQIEDEEINRVVTNSKEVKKGDIFLAQKGNLYNGNDYINEALLKGCSLAFSEERKDFNVVKVKNLRYIKEKLISILYSHIISKCIFIGVTGTNGKTTTSHIIYQILKNNTSSEVVLVGTNGIYYKNIHQNIDNTTPDELVIFNFIKDNINLNNKIYVVMEVSSHALSLQRLNHIYFDIAIYLNLSHEHLDYYKTLNNYAKAKSMLFYKLKNDGKAIINIDDQYSYFMVNLGNNNIFYGKKCNQNKFIIQESTLEKLSFIYDNITFTMPLIGNYNAYNACAAIIALKELNLNLLSIKDSLAKINLIPGRMEVHSYNNKHIIIDFAHTPLAMKKVLTFVRSQTSNKIITLFGCGGNRDKDKRPKMMEIASLYSDEVYLTSDNPRFEDPLDIIKDTLMGMKNDHVHLFVDRRVAIYNAVKNLNKDEYLLILGKGHEEEQIVLDKRIRFNDLEEVERWI